TLVTLCFLTALCSARVSARTGPDRWIVMLAAALVSVTTSMPPLRVTDFTPAPETARPLTRVAVHFFLPCLVAHALAVGISARGNVSPAGRRMAKDAIFAAPWPWLALMRSLA